MFSSCDERMRATRRDFGGDGEEDGGRCSVDEEGKD